MTDQRGFTLIEILVAFIIAAMALAGFMQAFGTGLRALTSVEESNRMVRVLRSQAALLSVQTLDEGEREEVVDGGLHVRTDVRPLDVGDLLPEGGLPLEPVSVEIAVQAEGPAGREASLRSVRLRPAE